MTEQSPTTMVSEMQDGDDEKKTEDSQGLS